MSVSSVTRAAPRPGLPAATTPALDLVYRFAEEWLPLVERSLARTMDGIGRPVPALAAAGASAVGIGGGGGHRWRPLLTLAAARACGGDPNGALRSAAAVELTHTASLILDDLPCMDDSPLRRNQPSTHVRVGTAGAILVAVGMLGRAAEVLGAEAGCRGAALAQAWGGLVGIDGMAGGQAVDLTETSGLRGAVRRLHREKTTALAAFALEAGAIMADAPAPLVASLGRFGRDLGWAYQMADDVDDDLEDRRVGRPRDLRRARRGIAMLMRRAERTVMTAEGLEPAGRDLLVAFGRSLVSLTNTRERPAC